MVEKEGVEEGKDEGERERNGARATRSVTAGEIERERKIEKMKGFRPCKVVVLVDCTYIREKWKSKTKKWMTELCRSV